MVRKPLSHFPRSITARNVLDQFRRSAEIDGVSVSLRFPSPPFPVPPDNAAKLHITGSYFPSPFLLCCVPPHGTQNSYSRLLKDIIGHIPLAGKSFFTHVKIFCKTSRPSACRYSKNVMFGRSAGMLAGMGAVESRLFHPTRE